MSGPATGIAYSLWLRLRWGAAATVAYLACLAIAVQLFPNSGEPVVLALLVMMASIAHLLHVFTLGPADFGVKTSGYPAHMFVLPLENRTLSGWPIVYGAASFATLWVLIVLVILMPSGFSPPIIWPAALIAASAAWVQAISWSPFPTPFARVPALALALTPLIMLGLGAGLYMESRVVAMTVTLGSLAWTMLAYWYAMRGVSRARCGFESSWVFLPQKVSAVLTRRRAALGGKRFAFPSATVAQLWHECRRNVLFLPAMMCFIGLPLLALNCLSVLNPTSDRTMLFGTVEISPAAMSLLIWIFVPLMLATSLGQGLGKFDMWGKDAMPAFFAIRPMTTTRFVLLKITAAAISSVACWAVIWLFLGVWALVEASSLNPRESLVRTAFANLTPQRLAMATAVGLGLVAIAWRTIVNGMWPSLAGRKSVSTGVALATWVALTIMGVAGNWIYRRPDVQLLLHAALPWGMAVLLLLKFGAAALAISALRKLELVEFRTTALLAAVWSAAAGGIFLGLCYFIPPSWILASSVVLLLPLARIAVAPVALHWNRHR